MSSGQLHLIERSIHPCSYMDGACAAVHKSIARSGVELENATTRSNEPWPRPVLAADRRLVIWLAQVTETLCRTAPALAKGSRQFLLRHICHRAGSRRSRRLHRSTAPMPAVFRRSSSCMRRHSRHAQWSDNRSARSRGAVSFLPPLRARTRSLPNVP